MAFLVKNMPSCNECLKNAGGSILSMFLVTFSIFFFNIENLCQVLSTSEVSNQLDHSNRNYGRAEQNLPPSGDTNPICKKPSLFRINSYQMTFSSFHTCSDAKATVVQCTTQEPLTLPHGQSHFQPYDSGSR